MRVAYAFVLLLYIFLPATVRPAKTPTKPSEASFPLPSLRGHVSLVLLDFTGRKLLLEGALAQLSTHSSRRLLVCVLKALRALESDSQRCPPLPNGRAHMESVASCGE